MNNKGERYKQREIETIREREWEEKDRAR
jgi:hypothetical protein